MGQHKKSKSWSALISLPTMLTPSSSSSTQQPTSQPTTSTNQDIVDNTKGTVEMKKSSSHQQHQQQHQPVDEDDTNEQDPSTLTSSTIPLFYLFSSEALANEYAAEDSIIPFMDPPTLALEQATLIAGVLESLVRVVEDIPTGNESNTNDDDEAGWNNDEEWVDNDGTPSSPFTIIGLGSFKVALWPSLLTEISHDRDLSLVVLVSPTYPDHTIIDTMYKMKNSLNRNLAPGVDTTNIAQAVGQHLSPYIKNGFNVECSL
ncbi:hypothetical protein BC941DRAFT_435973 [Chlamydoabsidia padenii]|nr:hypothetical protein BC941DRAFT_435973 [Chlamydoabsidia padenii]